MNANEIRTEVLLGSHGAVKTFLAPTIEALKAQFPALHVSYNGTGGIFVEGDDCRTAVIAARDALRGLQGFKVSRVWAFRGHTFGPCTWRFKLDVA
jgi:hypothetical protein